MSIDIYKTSASLSFQRQSILSFSMPSPHFAHLFLSCNLRSSLMLIFSQTAQYSQCSFTYQSFMSPCVSVFAISLCDRKKNSKINEMLAHFSLFLTLYVSFRSTHSNTYILLAKRNFVVQYKEIILANRIQFVSFSDNGFMNFTYIQTQIQNVRNNKERHLKRSVSDIAFCAM